jgi:hypothetical protein
VSVRHAWWPVSSQDIARVQALLDASYRAAGAHLRAIHTDQRCLTAVELVLRLREMPRIAPAPRLGAVIR